MDIEVRMFRVKECRRYRTDVRLAVRVADDSPKKEKNVITFLYIDLILSISFSFPFSLSLSLFSLFLFPSPTLSLSLSFFLPLSPSPSLTHILSTSPPLHDSRAKWLQNIPDFRNFPKIEVRPIAWSLWLSGYYLNINIREIRRYTNSFPSPSSLITLLAIYTQKHKRAHIQTHIQMHTQTLIHMHTHIHTHTYAHQLYHTRAGTTRGPGGFFPIPDLTLRKYQCLSTSLHPSLSFSLSSFHTHTLSPFPSLSSSPFTFCKTNFSTFGR